VQFARRECDKREVAIKFFLDTKAFYSEVDLFAAYFPTLKQSLDMPHGRRSDGDRKVDKQHQGANEASKGAHSKGCQVEWTGGCFQSGSIQGGRFLPNVVAVCDSVAAGLVDPRGHALPPCIVMERGESLQEWSDRAEPDRFTALSVWICPPTCELKLRKGPDSMMICVNVS
jgi:hypothetical protein